MSEREMVFYAGLSQKEGGMETAEPAQRSSECGSCRAFCALNNLKRIFTWHLLKTIAMGQALSVLICGTAVTCQYLAKAGVETPMMQSFLNYALLLLTYTASLSMRKGDGNIVQILKTKWWKYLLMALTDVEANYAVVKAYQFTSLTSIQLLDCFVIPVLMVLSWFFLRTRYRLVHFVAVAVCLLGVGAMVGADLLARRDQGSTSDVLLGDGLVLVSAALYAVSNVCQEYTVKNLGRVEFLGMMGLFGTLISGVQLAVLETSAVAVIPWDLTIILLLAAYVVCMYGLYSFMPLVMKATSATAVNLSLLTADLFSLFCGLFLFEYTFSGLYIVSFVVITVGFVMFNAVPTYTPVAQAVSSHGDRDNHIHKELTRESAPGGQEPGTDSETSMLELPGGVRPEPGSNTETCNGPLAVTYATERSTKM